VCVWRAIRQSRYRALHQGSAANAKITQIGLDGHIACANPYCRRQLTGKIKWPDTTPPTVTVVEPKFLPNRTDSKSLRATWLGHACYYVEFPGGLRVLFDPVFEDRCSPFSFMGPKRYTKVPCHIKDLPVVDVVAISHSHYGKYTSQPHAPAIVN
jgi:hypothetical protein